MKRKFFQLHYIRQLCLLAIWTVSFLPAAAQQKMPILILGADQQFAAYTGEILRTEGFNEYMIRDWDPTTVDLAWLETFDIVILPSKKLSVRQAKLLSQYVQRGGNLIAFRPDQKIAGLLGVQPAGNTTGHGYLAIETDHPIGQGLIREPLQFHESLEAYQLKEATAIARLYDTIAGLSGLPAVSIHKKGKGQAIAFFYDLPRSIANTRQGNYQHANQEKDGIYGLRAMDLFTDRWVDKSKNHLNQADEQMRLLSRCLEYVSKKPLPRFWYFPDTLRSVITLVNDGENNVETDFLEQFRDVGDKKAGMTLYVLLTGDVSKKFTDSLILAGHEIAAHPDATRFAAHPTWEIVNNAISSKVRELKELHGIEKVRTNTNHWFVWCGTDSLNHPDFTGGAKIEALNGIEMDVNYAHYDNGSKQGHFLGNIGAMQGNYTGSGLVMKFCDTAGNVIPVYQHFNNVYDQQYMELKDQEGFYQCFKGLLDRSVYNEVYSAICIRAHNNEYFFSKVPLMKMLEYATSKNIPVWTAARLLDFIQAKDAASFSDHQWKEYKLQFKIQAPLVNDNKFTTMVPFSHKGRSLKKILVNKLEQSPIKRTVKGKDYWLISLLPGKNYQVEATY